MDVFVYGTLTDPARVAELVDSYVFVGPARLAGLHPVSGRYPTLAPGGEVAGRLLRTDDVDALDRYEGVDAGLYVRVDVPRVAVSEGTTESDKKSESGENDRLDDVAVYVGDPARLDSDEPISWPGEGPLEARIRRYVADEDVVVHELE
ncbi:gamma-glutamylcyclotransferase [Haloprofundus marisrubri]|uniref:Gamma-glutamylcyclotransferase n=1 Tax=Haloprofundus marisrubri TaxID=1514971 RepID=A0A0W1RCA0_9EURY|nr:gamma-glutamylcyclotransferase family protein [Haloprofundus marisrubri]KTG10751.1 gamma-glutamylcyclotransferase [Haloprofundus marisrubri]